MHRLFGNNGVLYNCTGFYSTDVKGHGAVRMKERKDTKQGIDPLGMT